MSLLNDHKRCASILAGDGDEEKVAFVKDNLGAVVMSFGKHKGKSFRQIQTADPSYVWWVCNRAETKNSTMHLLKIYLKSFETRKPTIKRIIEVYESRDCKIPKAPMRQCEQMILFCRFCDEEVSVKETFSGNECSVCGFSFAR